MNVLLVEDDPVLAKGISLLLATEGYMVFHCQSLKEAQETEQEQAVDIVLLDLGLSDGNGLVLLKKLRDRGSRLPVIILTAQTDEETVVEGLENGANDFVKKPFGNRELIARMKTAMREPQFSENRLRYGPLLLLLEKRIVQAAGHQIELNRREFDVLSALMSRAESIVTRESLLASLQSQADIYDRTIDSHISHLRAKLRKQGVLDVRIKSVYGVGYRLEKIQ